MVGDSHLQKSLHWSGEKLGLMKRGRFRVSVLIRLFWRLGLFIVLILGSVTFVFPFVWMLSTSFKTPPQVWVQPPIWIPNPVTIDNYVQAWTAVPTFTYLKNTFLRSPPLAPT